MSKADEGLNAIGSWVIEVAALVRYSESGVYQGSRVRESNSKRGTTFKGGTAFRLVRESKGPLENVLTTRSLKVSNEERREMRADDVVNDVQEGRKERPSPSTQRSSAVRVTSESSKMEVFSRRKACNKVRVREEGNTKDRGRVRLGLNCVGLGLGLGFKDTLGLGLGLGGGEKGLGFRAGPKVISVVRAFRGLDRRCGDPIGSAYGYRDP